jgi:predicted component of type VI protein secretion system
MKGKRVVLLKKILVMALLLGFVLAGCLNQSSTPTPTPQGAGEIQSQADSIPIPSIDIPELNPNTGFENQPVDING